VDLAVFSGAVGLGLALTILRWVRRMPGEGADETPFGSGISGAFDEIVRAGRTVLHTPTLVYVFVAGAMISFGLNGIVGWGPTFVSRELGLSAAEAAGLLGKWGLISGTAGTLFGGVFADWLRRRYETARVIVVALGLLPRLSFWCSPFATRRCSGRLRARLFALLAQRADGGDLRRRAAASAPRWRAPACFIHSPATRSRCRWWEPSTGRPRPGVAAAGVIAAGSSGASDGGPAAPGGWPGGGQRGHREQRSSGSPRTSPPTALVVRW
jgi:hypothetical protein